MSYPEGHGHKATVYKSDSSFPVIHKVDNIGIFVQIQM